MMTQGVLPFQYEVEKKPGGMTALAGLPMYLDLGVVLGFGRLIREHLGIFDGDQGWTSEQFVTAGVMLNLAGLNCVDDLAILEADEGFNRLYRDVENYGLTGSQRRALKKRLRRGRTRTFPSQTAMRDHLELFHDKEQEKLRTPHTAFIPKPNDRLMGLVNANGALVGQIQRRSPVGTATVDMDATLAETWKKEAFYSYKKTKSFQPLNFYWAEQGVILYSEFRDGNVPANYDLLRPFEQSLDMVPTGVNTVYMRSDTAAYQRNLLKYCAEAKNKRFGVIEFSVSVPVHPDFKTAVSEVPESDWIPLTRLVNGKERKTGQEYAEVCFVPNWMAKKKDDPTYRFLAIREPLEQPEFPGLDDQLTLPFPTMDWGQVKYKVSGIVTNRFVPADEVIWWHRERCGKSEEAHSIMKTDLAGGQFPSGKFGANAAWWQIMILSLNLNAVMRRLVLGGKWVNRRMKAIRSWLIRVPGRVLTHSRKTLVRLVGGHPSNEILVAARRRMKALWESG